MKSQLEKQNKNLEDKFSCLMNLHDRIAPRLHWFTQNVGFTQTSDSLFFFVLGENKLDWVILRSGPPNQIKSFGFIVAILH